MERAVIATERVPSLVTYSPVSASDFDALADIRVAAMRESLERVGRFDPVRARERLRASFIPERTWWILIDGAKAGFYSTREAPEGLWLDHLYILPAYQNRGVGGAALREIFALAAGLGATVHVGALKESASNRFYQHHGFVLARETEWDNYYSR